jgi:hypothetical protein
VPDVDVVDDGVLVDGEVLGDALGEPVGGVAEVLGVAGDLGRDLLAQPRRELVPDVERIVLVDGFVDGGSDVAQPLAQVVVDLAGEILRAVAQGLLPASRAGAQLLGPGLRAFELLEHRPRP